MKNQPLATQRSRLGNILVKGAYIRRLQLTNALNDQAKQLYFTLRRQNWTRTVVTTIALACTSFTSVFASEKPNTIMLTKEKTIPIKSATFNNLKNPYSSNLFVSPINLDHQSKEFYYTGKHSIGFTKSISNSSGFQVSLFSEQATGYGSQISYEFAPQISLFKSSSTNLLPKFSYSDTKIGDRGNHNSNSIPIVYMLTLKGRCLLENSVNGTKMCSLDSAKKGVQRKAQLMFSVTKQF